MGSKSGKLSGPLDTPLRRRREKGPSPPTLIPRTSLLLPFTSLEEEPARNRKEPCRKGEGGRQARCWWEKKATSRLPLEREKELSWPCVPETLNGRERDRERERGGEGTSSSSLFLLQRSLLLF